MQAAPTEDSAELVKTVLTSGWAASYTADTDAALRLAEAFGEPIQSKNVPLVENLRIKESAEAPPRSLSAMHGTGAFPLHTDYAHWLAPPRFVLLRSTTSEVSVRPTFLLPLKRVALDVAASDQIRRHVWIASGGTRPFYTRLLCRVGGHDLLRFDGGCMRPAYPTAITAAQVLLEACSRVGTTEFDWTYGATLILDNWQVLHGRGSITREHDGKRCLQRIIVHNPRCFT